MTSQWFQLGGHAGCRLTQAQRIFGEPCSAGLNGRETESFLSFLSPSFQKHTYIALRSLPQAMYTAIAPLNINPPPEITRILLLYHGIKKRILM